VQPITSYLKISFRTSKRNPARPSNAARILWSWFGHEAGKAGDFPAPGFAYARANCLSATKVSSTTIAFCGIASEPAHFRAANTDARRHARTRRPHDRVHRDSVRGWHYPHSSPARMCEINRDAGQPGHGVEPRSRPRHQHARTCASPPHKYLEGSP